MWRSPSGAGGMSLALGIALASVAQVRADPLEDYVLEAFAAEESETHKRTELHFTRDDQETTYSIERVLPDRLRLIVRSESGQHEVIVVGDLMFVFQEGIWQVGPAPSRPSALPSVVDFLRGQLDEVKERAPLGQERAEYRRFSTRLEWGSGAGRNVGLLEITIDSGARLPKAVTFEGNCNGMSCGFQQVLFFDAAISIEPPIP